MHKEILTEAQVELLPLVGSFKQNFGMVGGTAVALQIGHRESIDFDMFSYKAFGNLALRNRIEKIHRIDEILVDKKGEFTFTIGTVKFTFFHYPFDINFPEIFENVICMPTLLTLAAMKSYALGHRAKWKDYVDLYFIIRDYHSLQDIVRETEIIFGDSFNPKLLRQQLDYFDDINYQEQVVFKPGFEVPEEEIKQALKNYSTA